MSSLNWLLLDLNSYFASVEQQEKPWLRNRPVAVVPMLADSTCALAASYEAKAFGIKTGTLVRDAKRMCPGIQLVEANHELYVDYHHRIIEVVESCIPVSAVLSIDEMICELRGSEKEVEKAKSISFKIKTALREKLGECIRCSVGIAPNRYIAKVASDIQKPDGLTIIFKEELPHRLYSLSLRDFPGIGRKMEQRLKLAGINQTEVLCSLSREALKQVWGSVIGEHFYEWIRGNDTHQLHSENQSISHSHVLPPDLRNAEGAYLVAQKLLHKAAFRLRKAKQWCRSLSVSVNFMNDTRFENRTKLIECQDDFTLLNAFQSLWKPLSKEQMAEKPIKVSIWMTDLVPDELHHFSFFENERGIQVSNKLDEINAKFGKGSVYFGGVAANKDVAPSAIAFSNIPDFDSD